jgi:uncharacterized protein Yka (UPF0111/DUF47 family)
MRLFPHSERFFDAFSALADRVTRCAGLLRDLLADPARADEVLAQTATLNHEAAELRHQVLAEGAVAVVTPLPREDVHHVASLLSDMVSTLHDTAGRAQSLHLGTAREPAVRLAEVVLRAARCMEVSVTSIRERNFIDERCGDMDGLEHEGHAIYDSAVEALFAGSPDPVEVIRWKELYDTLEQAIERCQAVENALSSIVLANRG